MHWVNIMRQRQPKDSQIVAYVEPSDANRKRAIEQFGVPENLIHPSLNDAAKKVKADFVLDVTPPAVHHDIARDAFAAGLHVVGEKPLSDDYGVAKRVVEMGK